jgi:hypothetical protein
LASVGVELPELLSRALCRVSIDKQEVALKVAVDGLSEATHVVAVLDRRPSAQARPIIQIVPDHEKDSDQDKQHHPLLR